LLGLAKDRIVEFKPSGFEHVAQWITTLAPLLLLGGIIGAYLEFKAPGFGVAGVLSAICFGLFFGGHYIAGLTGMEMPALFVLGILLILLELIFFPGIVVVALAGAGLAVTALFFSMADFYPAQPIQFSFETFRVPMWNLSLAILASVVLIAILARFLPSMPMFKSFFLSAKMNPGPSMAPVVTELGSAVSLKTGDSGTALSILRPSGRAKIGEGIFDVMTNGEFIEADAAVKVLAISGPNIVVGRAG
jgi:membrane-bound serine protease (ClpP class)